MAVPAVALFAGVMVIHGPGARLEGARSRTRRRKGPRARRRREVVRTMRQIDRLPRADESEATWLVRTGFHGTDEDLSTLTPSEINRRLDRLDKLGSKVNDKFIAAGRGHETTNEIYRMTDPLALEYNRIADETRALRAEISRRYGPGAPSRLPTRQPKSVGGRKSR